MITKHLKLSLLLRIAKFVSDEKYIRMKYRIIFGEDINLENPSSFNEKMNWLKLNYHNPIMTLMADKYWVKQHVSKVIGEDYVVPCYGHWKKLEDMDFKQLPAVFFLKSNQDSGGGILIDQRKGVDMKALKNRFSAKNIAKKNWFWVSREWGYKNIEPCILAEKYLDDGTGHELQDYKFWCFNGKPTYIYITNKGKVIKENFYDMNFNPVEINHGFERRVPEFDKPSNFEKMKEIAAILSKDLPFVRIDFFNVDNKLYFGECTFYDWGGLRPFAKKETDLYLGTLLEIPPK